MKSSRLHTSSLAPRHLHGRCIMAEGAAEAAECPDVCVGREVLTDFTYLFKTGRQGRVPTHPSATHSFQLSKQIQSRCVMGEFEVSSRMNE